MSHLWFSILICTSLKTTGESVSCHSLQIQLFTLGLFTRTSEAFSGFRTWTSIISRSKYRRWHQSSQGSLLANGRRDYSQNLHRKVGMQFWNPTRRVGRAVPKVNQENWLEFDRIWPVVSTSSEWVIGQGFGESEGSISGLSRTWLVELSNCWVALKLHSPS
jgi:hypothetical protein